MTSRTALLSVLIALAAGSFTASLVSASEALPPQVSGQGLFERAPFAGVHCSPLGTYRLEVTPVGGAPELPDVELAVSGPEGQEQRLRGVRGNGFLVSDRGFTVVLAVPESNAREGARISFEMTMPMGDHRYSPVPGRDGWQEADVVLPLCQSGKRRWYATVEGIVAGRLRTARFRLDLAPPALRP